MTKNATKSLLARHIKSLAALSRASSSRAVKTLQRGLTGERTLSGTLYLDSAEMRNAYSEYYFPISYMQIAYALADLPLPPARKSPLRIIDIGCGQGAASCAVIDKLRTAFPSCEIEVCLLDHSAKALSLAKSLIEREYPKITVRAHCVDLQPALLRTSRDLLALRDRIVSANLFRVISPCPHNFPCPALAAGESHTCHAEYPFLDVGRVKSLARDAGLERELVKMTYFLLRRESSPYMLPENASADAPFALPQNSLSGIVVSDAMTNKSCRVRCGNRLFRAQANVSRAFFRPRRAQERRERFFWNHKSDIASNRVAAAP